MRHEDEIEWLLDSGAFTAWKSGNPIALDDYCRFIEKLPLKPVGYFVLDVVGDAARTMENFRTMRRRGFTPIPVFTPGAPEEHIDEYYSEANVVAFGGIASKASRATHNYVALIMRKANGRNVHWLGYRNIEMMKIFRPYSCDTSSWSRQARWGVMDVYMGDGVMRPLARCDAKKKMSVDVLRRVAALGFDVRALQDDAAWRKRGLAQDVTYLSHLLLQRAMRRNLGTRYYLAVVTREEVVKICAAARRSAG